MKKSDSKFQPFPPDQLRALRQALGLRVLDLAASLGVSSGHLSNLEAGRRRLSPCLRARLEEFIAAHDSEIVPHLREFAHRREKQATEILGRVLSTLEEGETAIDAARALTGADR